MIMKKLFPVLLAALCLIVLVCAACGGGSSAPSVSVSATMAPTPTPSPEPTATPEPTDTPEPTATPEGAEESPEATAADEPENGDSGNANSGNSNSGGNSASVQQEESTPAPDPRDIAVGLTGHSVDELFAAIGGPNASSYTASCLVFDGEDGLLTYSGFEVATVRYSDGSEIILGVF